MVFFIIQYVYHVVLVDWDRRPREHSPPSNSLSNQSTGQAEGLDSRVSLPLT